MITASPPVWTSSTGILSTPADVPFFRSTRFVISGQSYEGAKIDFTLLFFNSHTAMTKVEHIFTALASKVGLKDFFSLAVPSSVPLYRLERRCSHAACPNIFIPSHIRDPFHAVAAPPEVHRRIRQIVDKLPFEGDTTLLPRDFDRKCNLSSPLNNINRDISLGLCFKILIGKITQNACKFAQHVKYKSLA